MYCTKQLIYSYSDDRETILVWQQDSLRWLDFGDGHVQTVIDLEDPVRLCSPVNRAMLLPIMIMEDSPRKILLFGAGGGAIARFFCQHPTAVCGEAVEISTRVATVARQYFDFPSERHGWRILEQDARTYLDNCQVRYDLIVVDIAQHGLTPTWIVDFSTLTGLRECLSNQGFLVLNLMLDDAQSFSSFLSNIRRRFEHTTACMSIPEYRNIMVFAAKQRPENWTVGIEQRCQTLSQHWGIEFDSFWRRMRSENPDGSGLF